MNTMTALWIGFALGNVAMFCLVRWRATRRRTANMLIGYGAGKTVSRAALADDLAALHELRFTGAQVVDEIELPSGMRLRPIELDALLRTMYPADRPKETP